MKVEIIKNEIILKELLAEDFSYCNIQGRDTGSVYYNPQRPEHSLRVIITDPAMVDILSNMGVNLSERVNELQEVVAWSFKVKAYPRVSSNRITGEEEQLPRIIITDQKGQCVRLGYDEFHLIDDAIYRRNLIDISVAFHMYEAKPYNRMTAAMDELKLLTKDYDELVAASQMPAEGPRFYL